MAINLPATIKTEIEKPHGNSDLLWLLELELDRGAVGVAPIVARLCDGFEQLTWPVSDPVPKTWDPFPFSFTALEQTQDGELSAIELSVDNSTRALMRYLHAGDGLEGNRALLHLVYRAGLSIAYPNHEYQLVKLRVLGAAANDEAIALRLGSPNWFQIQTPTDRHGTNCKHEFGDAETCGYIINALAAFTSCPKTPGACVDRGDDLIARGLPAVLPGNFGGKPGLSRYRA